ncbi:hypothetical protein HY406_01000 [Candidatus Giovannonibacteria bacterium]|nr:hypothetical protein [Candidatus Giovannonibacteria bacterium]
MNPVLQVPLNRTGRWPVSWGIPPESVIREELKKVTLLIREVTKLQGGLFVVDQSKLDIFRTDITNLADTTWGPDRVTGLTINSLWYGRVPIAGRYPGDPRITVEDVIANIGDFKPSTFIEVWTSSIVIGWDEKFPELGDIWRPIFITYVREQ